MAVCREVTKNAAEEAAFEYNDRRGCPREKSKGSSIVEMLVAIFVLGIVLISMLGMFLISRTAIYNKEDETANAIALRYIEELEGRPFGDFTSFNEDAEKKHIGKFRVAPSVPERNEYMAKVRVVVTWEAAVMGEKSLELERIISAGGYKNVGERN